MAAKAAIKWKEKMMQKAGLFPEEAQKLKNWMALPKDERPTWKEMAKLFSVSVDLLKNFFPKKAKIAGRAATTDKKE